jgi:outer membrane receptor protein involved in Fe transport
MRELFRRLGASLPVLPKEEVVRKHAFTSLALVGLLALSATFASPVAAQVTTGKLTGVVTDGQTGEPLTGVQVYLEGTGRGALTAENGRYFLINVPPDVYTVVAELIGYQTYRVENVQIGIDMTRVVDFGLTQQAIAVEEIRVEAEATPLIRLDATSSVNTTTGAELDALPVTSIEEALSLQQGFLEVPENMNIIAFVDTRRGLNPVRIRGGRSGETLTLIDGIPINNFVFGGPALSITRKAVSQIDFIRGGFEPQYGNALSGIINISTREGGRDLRGAFEYQTTEFAGALGSTPDDIEGFDFFEGYIGGPVPGTEFGSESPKLRFMVSARQASGASRVLEFDDDVYDPATRTRPETTRLTPANWDVFAGWRAFGYDETRDLLGKLTFLLKPTVKLNLSILDYSRQQQVFDFDWMRKYANFWESPLIDTLADTAWAAGLADNWDASQASVQIDRTLAVASFNHTFSRTAYSIKAGIFEQSRTSCNFYNGLCLRDAFDDPNFDNNRFIRGGVTDQTPAVFTDTFGFGGETLSTLVARFDIQSQVTDHHNLQAGIYYEGHDLDYRQSSNIGTNEVIVVDQFYSAKPFNAATYIQDKVEYDFVTVALGFRVDWGKAGGLFFRDLLDPTNGTTAIDVCTDPAAFGPVAHPVTGELIAPNSAWTIETCSGATRDSATVVAFGDDLEESKTRLQFSPRIGVSFPITASSNVFFNFSRLSQNPLFNNIYQNTSIGMPGEGVPCGFAEPGAELTADCGPIIESTNYTVPYLGNPNLLIESTTTYEIGFLAELFDDYAVSLILYNKDQFGLTGLRQAFGISDPGATYGTSTPAYSVLGNRDYQTVRGFEIAVRRRVTDFWGFELNYAYSQARTNAAPPDREFENQDQGLPEVNREIVSDIDIPHRFNGIFYFHAGEEAPLGSFLKHSSFAATLQTSSGYPYTPTTGFNAGEQNSARLFRNTARGPSLWWVDLRAEKNFRIGNLLYGAFVRVDNVFDTKNCIQPFETTGDCDSGAIDQLRSRQGNATNPEAVNSTYYDRPQIFGPRRRVNFGLRMSF